MLKRLRHYCGLLLSSVRKRGLVATGRMLVGEYWFDLRFRSDTRPRLLAADEGIVGAHRASAAPHFGTNWFILGDVFRRLARELPGGLAGAHLVDFGCGAGRALMAALRCGVGEVTGVEFSRELCQRAEVNLQRFVARRHAPAGVRWHVVHADAADFAVPADATVFFLYNPFGPPVIGAVAARVAEHARRLAQPVRVVYVNPVHRDAFLAAGFTVLPGSDDEVCHLAGPAPAAPRH